MGNLFEWAKSKGYLLATDSTQFYTDPAASGATAADYANFIVAVDGRITDAADRLLFYQTLVDMGALAGTDPRYWAEKKFTGAAGDDIAHVAAVAAQAFSSLSADPGGLTNRLPAATTTTTATPGRPVEQPGPGTPPPPPPPVETPPPPLEDTPVDYNQMAQFAAPWLPPELQQIYADAWAQHPNDPDLALDIMRAHPSYESYFPGNRRSDGSLRYDELGYVLFRKAFNNELIGYGLNPEFFGSQFMSLLTGDVAIPELAARLDAAYQGLVTNFDAVREYYAANFGLTLSNEAIFASALDPTIGEQVLDQRIAVSQIGGEAAIRGFNVGIEFATRIRAAGLGQKQSAALFGTASRQLPVLEQLARRHNDPDDTFDLNEFVDANVFFDADQQQRTKRLLSQEAASFNRVDTERVTRDSTRLTGLFAR